MSMSLFNYIAYAEENRNKLSSTDKAILFTIAVKCNDDGRLCCTQREVAKMLEMAPSNFSRKVAQFEAMGILHRVNGSIAFDDTVVKGSMPYRKDWSDSSRYGTQGYQTDNVYMVTGGSEQIAEVISQITRRYHIDNPDVITQITRVISEITPSRKEEKNKKRVNACACACEGETPISDAQAAHLGCSVSARPNRNVTGKPEERVKVVVARPTSEHSTEAKDKASLGAFIKEYPKRAMNRFAVCAEWAAVEAEGIAGKRILAAMREAKMSKQWNEDNKRYVPRAENFLKDRIFEDFLPNADERASVKTQAQRDAEEDAAIKEKYDSIAWLMEEEI